MAQTFTNHKGIKSALGNQPEKGQSEYRDTRATGLYFRVYSTGHGVFVHRYKIEGKRRVFTFSDIELRKNTTEKQISTALNQARAVHAEQRIKIKRGTDPALERDLQLKEVQEMPTVEQFAVTYINRHAKRKKKSWEEDQRILAVDVLPYIGSLKLDKVSKRHVSRLLDRKLDAGYSVAHNRLLSLLSKFFNFAISRGEIQDNPTSKIPKERERKRTRTLSDDEIRLLWNYTSDNSPLDISTRFAVRLRLITGQRSSEIVNMREEDIKGDVWYQPDTKNGLPHALPITDLMQQIIDEARPHARNGLLLPSRKDTVMKVQVLSKIFERIDWQLKEGQTRPTPHDLRRTFRTGLGELKFDNFIQRKVTNHKSNTQDENDIDRIYNGYEYMDEKRQALEAWSQKLTEIIGE